MDNDINSDLIGLKKDNILQKKKNLFIGIAAGTIFLVILIIIILLIVKGPKNEEKGGQKDKDKDKEDERDPSTLVGLINCIYDVNSISENTLIFGDEFNKENDFDVYIDGTKVKYSKEYKFNSTNYHLIQIYLYDSLNMDYMFKGVKSLTSYGMISDHDAQILSMKSTFENCENLYSFTIIGFNVENVKSMTKLFYHTDLTEYSFTKFKTTNLEDISYMFAYSSISEFKIIVLFFKS